MRPILAPRDDFFHSQLLRYLTPRLCEILGVDDSDLGGLDEIWLREIAERAIPIPAVDVVVVNEGKRETLRPLPKTENMLLEEADAYLNDWLRKKPENFDERIRIFFSVFLKEEGKNLLLRFFNEGVDGWRGFERMKIDKEVRLVGFPDLEWLADDKKEKPLLRIALPISEEAREKYGNVFNYYSELPMLCDQHPEGPEAFFRENVELCEMMLTFDDDEAFLAKVGEILADADESKRELMGHCACSIAPLLMTFGRDDPEFLKKLMLPETVRAIATRTFALIEREKQGEDTKRGKLYIVKPKHLNDIEDAEEGFEEGNAVEEKHEEAPRPERKKPVQKLRQGSLF